MDALDKFFSTYEPDFDFRGIISPEVEEFDSVIPPGRVYKYLGSSRRSFFRRPALRFTQRTGLNDPFELSKRWQEFASAAARKSIADYVKTAWAELAANKGTVLEILKQKLAKEGTFIGPDQMAEASHMLLSNEGRRVYNDFVNHSSEYLEQYVETAFAYMGAAEFDEVTSALGILSASENPIGRAMWALYASEGRGFVVELDTAHDFFRAPNGRNLLWKVKYTNDRAHDFLSNPLVLLLTKHEEYAFEREWRLVKRLSECDEKQVHNGQEIYVCQLRPGSIKSVIFGYNYDKEKIAEDGAWLRTFFDPNIHIQMANPNRSTGEIEVDQLV